MRGCPFYVTSVRDWLDKLDEKKGPANMTNLLRRRASAMKVFRNARRSAGLLARPWVPVIYPRPVQYAVLCTSRTGSTLLCDSLARYFCVPFLGELRNDIPADDIDLKKSFVLKVISDASDWNIPPWIHREPFVESILRDNRIRLICLERKDRTSQFLSWAIGRHTRTWHTRDTGPILEKLRKNPLVLDRSEFDLMAEDYRLFLAIRGRIPRAFVQLFYEDFEHDFRTLFRALSLRPPGKPLSRLRKMMSNEEKRSCVANVGEIERWIVETFRRKD